MPRLSAGRVQSVATRLVVDRERERIAFRSASYWDLEGTFDAGAAPRRADVPRQAALHRRRPGRPRLGLRQSGHARASPRAAPASSTWTGRAPRRSSRRCTTRRSRSARSSPSPTPASPTRRSAPRRCSRRPPASWASARVADDVGGAAAVRERLHHLHAHRLDHAVGVGGRRGARAGPRAVRRGVPPGRAAHLRLEGEERPGGARGDPPGGRERSARRRRPGCPATSSGSTS